MIFTQLCSSVAIGLSLSPETISLCRIGVQRKKNQNQYVQLSLKCIALWFQVFISHDKKYSSGIFTLVFFAKHAQSSGVMHDTAMIKCNRNFDFLIFFQN